jgi:hypothetical protein
MCHLIICQLTQRHPQGTQAGGRMDLLPPSVPIPGSNALLMPIHLGKGNSFTAQRNVCHTFFNTAGASLTTPMPRPPNTSTQYHWHKVPTSDCEFLFCKVPPLNRKVLTTPVSSLHSPHAWDNRWLEVIFQLLFTWVIARYSYECFRCSAEMAG